MILETDCETVVGSSGAVAIAGVRCPLAYRADVSGKFIFDTQTPMEASVGIVAGHSDADVRQDLAERHAEFRVDSGVLIGCGTVMQISKGLGAHDESVDVEVIAGGEPRENGGMRWFVDDTGGIGGIHTHFKA